MTAFICAAWLGINLIAPSANPGATVTKYIAQRGNATVPFEALNLYRSPTDLTTPTPSAPGQPQTVWCSITQEPYDRFGWRRGGQAIRIRYATSNGDTSAWSNYVIAAVVNDSLYKDACGRLWLRPPNDPSPVSEWFTATNTRGSFVGRSRGWQHAKLNTINPQLWQVVFWRVPGDTLLAGCDQVAGKCARGFGPIVHSERFLCSRCYQGDYWACSEPTCAELAPCPCGSAVRGAAGPPCP